MIIKRLFEKLEITNGFYVDVGAHHPYRFSNTYRLYKEGWRGLNIDPRPGTSALFRRKRKRDLTLEIGISKKAGDLEFFLFNEPALSTFSREEATRKSSDRYFVVETSKVQTLPLSTVLNQLENRDEIDLLTIDVEGLDYEVLESNDWGKYKPKLILLEILDCQISELASSKSGSFLMDRGYTLVCKTKNTFFFLRADLVSQL